MLPSTRLTKEGVEGVISSTNGFVGGHLAVWLNAMLQTVEFPASVTNLHSSLPNMNRDALTLEKWYMAVVERGLAVEKITCNHKHA